jgi:hypothetical protein
VLIVGIVQTYDFTDHPAKMPFWAETAIKEEEITLYRKKVVSRSQ